MKFVLKIIALLITVTLLLWLCRPFYIAHEIATLKTMIVAGDVSGVSKIIAKYPQLIECDVMSGDRVLHMTPLSFAANCGQYVICSNLIAAGANVNAKSEGNLTSLMWALNMSETNIIVLLLQNGADVGIKTSEGKTALDFTVKTDNSNYFASIISNAMSGSARRAVRP